MTTLQQITLTRLRADHERLMREPLAPRTLREAGWHGDIEDEHPTPGGFVGTLGAAVFGALLLWGFLILVLA